MMLDAVKLQDLVIAACSLWIKTPSLAHELFIRVIPPGRHKNMTVSDYTHQGLIWRDISVFHFVKIIIVTCTGVYVLSLLL
jgi:hypothetical protein